MTNVITPPENTVTTSSAKAAIPEAQTKPRKNWSPSDKAACVALFRESGKTQSEFAKQFEIPPATLSLWLRQERDGADSESDGEEDGAL